MMQFEVLILCDKLLLNTKSIFITTTLYHFLSKFYKHREHEIMKTMGKIPTSNNHLGFPNSNALIVLVMQPLCHLKVNIGKSQSGKQ